jgi:hypothetical protein
MKLVDIHTLKTASENPRQMVNDPNITGPSSSIVDPREINFSQQQQQSAGDISLMNGGGSGFYDQSSNSIAINDIETFGMRFFCIFKNKHYCLENELKMRIIYKKFKQKQHPKRNIIKTNGNILALNAHNIFRTLRDAGHHADALGLKKRVTRLCEEYEERFYTT